MARTQTGAPAHRLPMALGLAGIALIGLLSAQFVGHAAGLGWQGLTRDLSGQSRFDAPDAPLAAAAIFLHMLGGAVATALAPVQLIGPLRRRAPAVHRWSGRALALSAGIAGLGGLVYIARAGTVGGPAMSAAFALYGACLLVAAGQAVRHARAGRFSAHRRWALRLAVLALASWIYRLHYALWVIATDGAAMADDFSGAFDRVNIWAFFLPYLLALEALFAAERRRARLSPARPAGGG